MPIYVQKIGGTLSNSTAAHLKYWNTRSYRRPYCYVLYDTEYPDGAVGVFTGDALFVVMLGATDLSRPQKRSRLGPSIFSIPFVKLLCLVIGIIYPAHGSGSVCGSSNAAVNSQHWSRTSQ